MKSDFFLIHRGYVYLYTFVLFAILLTTTILLPHVEGDELVYQTLGQQLVSSHTYSLQNTDVLKYLSQDVYDTPIFFRPPVFSLYLAFLYSFLGVLGFRIAPVVVYILLCFTLYKIVLQITKSQNSALKALVLSTLSPLMIFSSVQIHLDLFMTLMASLAFYFILLFRESKKLKYCFLSGLFIALAILTKFTAVILYPILLFYIVYRRRSISLLLSTCLFLLPSLLIILWLYIFFVMYGMPLNSLFSTPTKQMLTNSTFLTYVSQRPFYYYLLHIFVTNLLYLFALLLFRKKIYNSVLHEYGKLVYLLIFVIGIVFSCLTLYGINGGTYQMRYILLAEPFIIILLSLIPFEKNETFWNFFWFFVLYNLLLVIYNIGYGNAELFTFLEIINRLHPA